MAFGRFERKIVAAIAAVAIMPLVGALFFGQTALREAYGVGVNTQVREQLEAGLVLYQEHFAGLRKDAQRTARAAAQDVAINLAVAPLVPEAASLNEAVPAAMEALLARYDNVAQLELVQGGRVLALRTRKAAPSEPQRMLTLEEPLARASDLRLRVTVGAPAREFGDYQKAGELTEVYRALERGSDYVSRFYLAAYIALLLSVIVVALGIGISLSRRVTKRVSQLAEATARVGAGDLTVHVPDDDRDEVGDLTRAFNTMVKDMRESRERIEYLSRISAWQEFARRLAHEIKNPLTPIQLAVQEIHRSYPGDDPRFRRALEDTRSIVEEEIATLRRLVGEFSEFARLPEAHLASADLGVFVREAMDSPFRADETDEPLEVEVRTAVASGALPVMIDSMLLKRCLDNLVRNAVQAIRGHQIKSGVVTVQARAVGPSAWLEVRDNGPGVPDDMQDRVFDPYYTTKAEGTGLGLAIVKKIVLEHRGEISCLRAPEGGACFRIALPLGSAARTGNTRP